MGLMVKQVGYLTNYSSGLEGERGIFFNYILAGNGLFIEASKRIISARIPVGECAVRGLAPLKPKITLTYGSIPQHFFDLALSAFLAAPDKESYVAVTADAGYHFYVPEDQHKEEQKVVYKIGDSVILDIHSHGKIPAHFSPQDYKDETGFQLYAVVGSLGDDPMVSLRIGVYGYFWPLLWKDVFDGTLYGAKEFEDQEVIQDELYSEMGGEAAELEVHSSGMWWHRWFRG